MPRRKLVEVEEDLAAAESVIEQAAAAIEAGDIKGAKSILDGYLEPDEEGEEEDTTTDDDL